MGKITDMIMASVLLNDEQGGGGYPEPSGSIDIVENGIYDVKDYAEANVDIDTSAVLFVDDEHPELRIKLAEPLAGGGQHIGIAYKLFGASTTTDAFKIHINTVTKSMYGDDDVWKDFSLQVSASMVGATEIVINQTKSGSKLYIYGVVTHGNGETRVLEAGEVVNTSSLLAYDKVEGGGSDITVDKLVVSENGTYEKEGIAFSPVVVDVQSGGGNKGMFVDDTQSTVDILFGEPYTKGNGNMYVTLSINAPATTTTASKVAIHCQFIGTDGQLYEPDVATSKYWWGVFDARDKLVQIPVGIVGYVGIRLTQQKAGTYCKVLNMQVYNNVQTAEVSDNLITVGKYMMYQSVQLKPKKQIDITANGQYDVSAYGTAVVDVQGGGGSSPQWTNLSYFYNSGARLDDIPPSKLDTSKVTNMDHMFYACHVLTTLEFGDKFDTSNVTGMGSMFGSCSKLTSIDFTGWDTNKVTSMNSFISSCRALKDIYIRDTKLRPDGNLKFKLPVSGVFDIIRTNGGTIHLSKALQPVYETATNWTAYTDIMVFDLP